MKLCSKHSKAALDRAERKRVDIVRRRKKEPQKIKQQMLNDDAQKTTTTFKLILTGDDVDGSILLEDTSTSGPRIDNKNFKKEQLS